MPPLLDQTDEDAFPCSEKGIIDLTDWDSDATDSFNSSLPPGFLLHSAQDSPLYRFHCSPPFPIDLLNMYVTTIPKTT